MFNSNVDVNVDVDKEGVSKDIRDKFSTDELFLVINSYFKEHGLVSHQIRSFDKFIHEIIPKIIKKYPPILIKDGNKQHIISYGDFKLKSCMIKENDWTTKKLTPNECRLRGLTYGAPACVDLICKTQTLKNGQVIEEKTTISENILIGYIPIMLKSRSCVFSQENKTPFFYKECPHDEGGYFVVGGGEKVIVAQERLAYNIPYVFKKGEAEVRSYSYFYDKQTTVYIKFLKSKKSGNVIRVALPYVKKEIPLAIIFRAFGIIENQDILRHIVYDIADTEMVNLLNPSLEESSDIYFQNDALYFIGEFTNIMKTNTEQRVCYVRELLKKEVFPHIDDRDENIFVKKAFYLGHIVNKLLKIELNRRGSTCDDRDHLGNKRLDTCGPLLGSIFKQKFKKQHTDMIETLHDMVSKKKEINLEHAMKSKGKDVTGGLSYALKTGRMSGSKSNNSSKQGAAQVLNRLDYLSTLSHQRRISVPGDSNVAVVRYLHNTHFGKYCVVGDTMVTLANGDKIQIKDMDEHSVNILTVNPKDLTDEPSRIYNAFFKQSEQIHHIVTDCGKNIRCTGDHPFLVLNLKGQTKWVKATDLRKDMLLVTIDNGKLDKYRKLAKNKMISCVENITIEPGEIVYDFTTKSSNHSFIANGFVTHNCPAETPEGASCGIVKNMAMLCHVTTGESPIALKEWTLRNFDIIKIENLNPKFVPTSYLVFINGNPVGALHTANLETTDKLVTEFKYLFKQSRQRGEITFDTAIAIDRDQKEIWLCCDGGRCCRPLFTVDGEFDIDGNTTHSLKIKRKHMQQLRQASVVRPYGWSDLIKDGVIEYMDVSEEEDASVFIAFDQDDLNSNRLKFSHAEIHPSTILGVGASMIPFPEHNQAPRNTYQSGKFFFFSYFSFFLQLNIPTISFFSYGQTSDGIVCIQRKLSI